MGCKFAILILILIVILILLVHRFYLDAELLEGERYWRFGLSFFFDFNFHFDFD